MARNQSKRQEAKERNRLFKDLYFLIQWLDNSDEMMYDAVDAVSARDITPPMGVDVLNLQLGQNCQASFASILYDAKVLSVGKYTEIKREQAKREKEAEMLDCENITTCEDSDPCLLGEGLSNDDKKTRIKSTKDSQQRREVSEVKSLKDSQDSQKVDQNPKKDSQTRSSLGQKGSKKKGGQSQKGSSSQSGQSQKDSDQHSHSQKAGGQSGLSQIYGGQHSQGQLGGRSQKGNSQHGQSQKDSPRQNVGHSQNSGLSSGSKDDQKSQNDRHGQKKDVQTPTTSRATNRLGKSPRKRLLTPSDSDTSSEFSDEDYVQPKKPRTQVGSRHSPHLSRRCHGKMTPRKPVLKPSGCIMLLRMNFLRGLSPGIPSTTLTSEVTKLKEKIRVLERSHTSLKRKVSEQAIELKHLTKLYSSADISSASEATPAPEVSPVQFKFVHPQHGPLRRSPSFPIKTPQEDVPDFVKDVDPVKLAHAKLQPDAGNAALKLMNCVFTTEELVNGNPSGITKSKDPTRQRTIRPLDGAKMKYINAILQEKWGVTTADKGIRKRMTQKCTDYFSDSRYKHLRCT